MLNNMVLSDHNQIFEALSQHIARNTDAMVKMHYSLQPVVCDQHTFWQCQTILMDNLFPWRVVLHYNLQLALNDPSYKNFRLQMEIASQLFQSWVGGHMSSDLSPFDPVFLSHIAFIDKIWDTWQKKHKNGLLLYPDVDRYVPINDRILQCCICHDHQTVLIYHNL
jgi:hypothetical protein